MARPVLIRPCMEMFLMVLTLSLVGVLVSGILFRASTREVGEHVAALNPLAMADEERFFVIRPPAPATVSGAGALVLEIERHVRLERAAAEAFLQFPTAAALHMRTMAPLAR
jgi:hypothetical protein